MRGEHPTIDRRVLSYTRCARADLDSRVVIFVPRPGSIPRSAIGHP
jgi:hypothetical protein